MFDRNERRLLTCGNTRQQAYAMERVAARLARVGNYTRALELSTMAAKCRRNATPYSSSMVSAIISGVGYTD